MRPQGDLATSGILGDKLSAAGICSQLELYSRSCGTAWLISYSWRAKGRVVKPEWAHKLPNRPSWHACVALTSLGTGPQNLTSRLDS